MQLSDDATRGFDLEAFLKAFEEQDVDRWADFFDEDAEWVEYRQGNPPRSPQRTCGKANIHRKLMGVKASEISITIEDPTVGEGRAGFRVWVDLPDGRRIIEHVIVHHVGGLIIRQVDVEAWD